MVSLKGVWITEIFLIGLADLYKLMLRLSFNFILDSG